MSENKSPFENSPFNDYPIEFKEINPSDFPSFKVSDKEIITPNDSGYINEELQSRIDFKEKNTVVINAAVGQGKTYSIIEVVKKYYDEGEDYLIFVASPYVSLVQQYYHKILKEGIPKEDVYRYEWLGEADTPKYIGKKIHIVTVNCLLGNPGEDAFINSDVKRVYLQELSDLCKKEKKKVVFIYDEIHDAIHNFREKYMFNLWKWKSVIHKNFIISATFNEASKVVIEYLAELTDDKIQIIESKRVRYPGKQSELHLHYNPSHRYEYNNEQIVSVFKDLVDRGKEIDLLCFSKKLIEGIMDNKDEGVGKVLYGKYDEINNCTSELIKNQRTGRTIPQNRYNKDKCNIGTNFKSGVSIEKDNHAFVVVLPPSSARMPFQNLYGIFSSGINSIIQALARQRKKGEIHIILPRPDKFDFTTLPFFQQEEKQRFFSSIYTQVSNYKDVEYPVKYIPLDKQNNRLFYFYNNTYKANVKDEIKLIEESDRKNKVRLIFPEFRLFVLEDGEDYLANSTPFFGADLSAYVTYSALTNQFINCKLARINFKASITIEEGKIQEKLIQVYNDYYYWEIHDDYFQHANDSLFFKEVKEQFFKDYHIYIKLEKKIKGKLEKKPEKVTPNGKNKASKVFNTELLNFCKNYRKGKCKIADGNYTLGSYILDCLAHLDTVVIDEYNEKRITSLKYLGKLRDRMIEIQPIVVSGEDVHYLPNNPFEDFIPESENKEFEEMLDYLLKEDPYLKNSFINPESRFVGKPLEKKKETIYKILLENLFSLEKYRLPTGGKKRDYGKKVISVLEIPNKEDAMDWLTSMNYELPDYYYYSAEEILRNNRELGFLDE